MKMVLLNNYLIFILKEVLRGFCQEDETIKHILCYWKDLSRLLFVKLGKENPALSQNREYHNRCVMITVV